MCVPHGLCSHTVAIQTIPAIFIFLFSLPYHHQSNTLAALAAGNQVEMMHLALDDLHIIILKTTLFPTIPFKQSTRTLE